MINCDYKVSIKDIQNRYTFKVFSPPRGEKGERGETGFIGTPLVVNSVDQMTDTSRNYINTTNGHWYYYNGSSWADGGLYQATGIDLDNGVIKNIYENIDLTYDYVGKYLPTEIGAFLGTDLEEDVGHSSRLRTPVLNLIGTTYIEFPQGYSLNIYKKINGTTSYVTYSDTGKLQYTFLSTEIYRFLIKKSDNSTITDTIDVKIINLDNNIKNELSDLSDTTNQVNSLQISNEHYIKDDFNNINYTSEETTENFFYTRQNGTPVTLNGAKCVVIPVKPTEKYQVSGISVSDLSVVVYFNSLMKFVSSDLYYTDANRHTFKNEEITVPSNTYYMAVQTRDTSEQDVVIKKKIQKYTNNFDILTSLERNAYIDKKLGYHLDTLDKGYIAICVDDGNTDIDVIADIFKNDYNFPLNLAIPPSRLNVKVTNTTIGYNVNDVCKYVQNNGGEILSHSYTVITNDNVNDFDIMYDQFSNNKRLLTEAGLNVNGIILAGGTGEISNSITDMWARKYYNYSDRYGDSLPYNQARTNIAKTTLANLKTLIDNCVTNKTFLPLSFHGLADYGITTDGTSAYLNGFTTNDLEAILDYIKTYVDNNQLEVVRYSYVYDTFGKFGNR